MSFPKPEEVGTGWTNPAEWTRAQRLHWLLPLTSCGTLGTKKTSPLYASVPPAVNWGQKPRLSHWVVVEHRHPLNLAVLRVCPQEPWTQNHFLDDTETGSALHPYLLQVCSVL